MQRFSTLKESSSRARYSLAVPQLPTTSFRRLETFPGVWLKCEHENPTGSHKDRAYCAMLKTSDRPLKGRTLVDYTTGNGGISMAWLARHLGLPAVAFMPEGMTPQREALIRHYGAQLVLTPADGFVATAREAAEAYVEAHPEAILLGQSDNLANEWGFTQTGKEILQQCHECDVHPSFFVCAIGTGGSFSGITRMLKGELGDKRLTAIAIEVPEAPVIWAKRRGQIVVPTTPSIIGMGAGKIARNTDERLIDDIELVGGTDISAVLEIVRKFEGLHVGPSTAANIIVASRLAKRHRANVVTISFDHGNRYP